METSRERTYALGLSFLIIAQHFVQFEFEEINILGNTVTVQDTDSLIVFFLLVWGYFVLRFCHQFYVALLEGSMFSLTKREYRKGLDLIAKDTLFKASPKKWGFVYHPDYQYLISFTHKKRSVLEIRTFIQVNEDIMKIKDDLAFDSEFNYVRKYSEIKLPMLDLSFYFVRTIIHSLLADKTISEYFIPLVVIWFSIMLMSK